MTRKDYVKIAAAIRQHVEANSAESYQTAFSMIAKSVADVLADDNARFDRQRFLTACGVNE